MRRIGLGAIACLAWAVAFLVASLRTDATSGSAVLSLAQELVVFWVAVEVLGYLLRSETTKAALALQTLGCVVGAVVFVTLELGPSVTPAAPLVLAPEIALAVVMTFVVTLLHRRRAATSAARRRRRRV